MALGTDTRLGPYDSGSLIGVGGMGEVYRARDTTTASPLTLILNWGAGVEQEGSGG